MAKVTFNKLNLTKNTEIKNIDINENIIEVKQYLPVEEKLKLISYIVNMAHDEDYNFSNPVKVEVFAGIGIIKYYTNITFTEKQLENPAKIYDLLNWSNVIENGGAAIPSNEYNEIRAGIEDTIKSIYQYQNSALGILDTIGQDYSDLNLEADTINEKLSNPDNMKLLRDVLAKLG